MQTCQRCGAGLDDSIAKCPYCGTETPRAPQIAAAAWQAHAQAQVGAAQQAQRVGTDVAKTSMQALVLSLLGFFICCPPLAIWSLVVALRARASAKATGIALPASAVVAFVFFTLHSLAVLGFSVWFAADMHAHDVRLAELRRILDTHAGDANLTQPTACALAEHRLLSDGFEGNGGLNIENFSCDGRLVQNGDRAELEEVRFHSSASSVVSARVCLTRGQRWTVREITRGTCPTPNHP